MQYTNINSVRILQSNKISNFPNHLMKSTRSPQIFHFRKMILLNTITLIEYSFLLNTSCKKYPILLDIPSKPQTRYLLYQRYISSRIYHLQIYQLSLISIIFRTALANLRGHSDTVKTKSRAVETLFRKASRLCIKSII